MGQTGPGQIGNKLKGARFNSADKTASKYSKINNYFIQYVTNTLVKNEY